MAFLFVSIYFSLLNFNEIFFNFKTPLLKLIKAIPGNAHIGFRANTPLN